jgi:hypothetical protein
MLRQRLRAFPCGTNGGAPLQTPNVVFGTQLLDYSKTLAERESGFEM